MKTITVPIPASQPLDFRSRKAVNNTAIIANIVKITGTIMLLK
jgi:hypothetical protein